MAKLVLNTLAEALKREQARSDKLRIEMFVLRSAARERASDREEIADLQRQVLHLQQRLSYLVDDDG